MAECESALVACFLVSLVSWPVRECPAHPEISSFQATEARKQQRDKGTQTCGESPGQGAPMSAPGAAVSPVRCPRGPPVLPLGPYLVHPALLGTLTVLCPCSLCMCLGSQARQS